MSSLSTQRRGSPTGYRPPLFYLLAGLLNILVWRLPFPHRVLARMSTTVYRNPPMSARAALEVLDALQAEGIRHWVGGGWGVDALVGERTRSHHDLDLVVEDIAMESAVQTIERLGYWEWYRSESEVPMFSRIVMHNHDVAGRAVDIHPLRLSGTRFEFTTGNIGGREVPCLSVNLQLKTHSSYKKRWRDRADLAMLRKLAERSVTTLIVPVPAAASLRHKSARDPGMPAHITVLYPFLSASGVDEETEALLARLLAGTPAFDFKLDTVGHFPGVVYLAPDPAEPFVALTSKLAEQWPDHPPYGDAFEEIIPHLTVAHGGKAPPGVSERLPVRGRAEEVWLMSKVAGRWIRRARFQLGEENHLG